MAAQGEWKTLIPAYLLKDRADLQNCKTLLPMKVALGCMEGGPSEPEKETEAGQAGAEPEEAPLPTGGHAVWLHIYDLTESFHLPWINSALRSMDAGLFHAGVEVHGHEFSFGMTRYGQGTGLFMCRPKKNGNHAYRESLFLGHTSMRRQEVKKVTQEMKKEWMGHTYRLLSKNCIHFSAAFSKRLGVKEVPRWVFGMASLAQDLVQSLANRTEAMGRAISLTNCNGSQLLDEIAEERRQALASGTRYDL